MQYISQTTYNYSHLGGTTSIDLILEDYTYLYVPQKTGGSWFSITADGVTQGDEWDTAHYTITVQENTGNSRRSGTILLRSRDSGGTVYETTLYVFQAYRVAGPIWYDTFYTEEGSNIEYSIILDGTEIYKGRAGRRPNETGIKVNVAEICKDYVYVELPDFRDYDNDVFASPTAIRDFTLLSWGEAQVTYRFMYNWTYDYEYMPYKNPERDVFPLSDPINGRLDPRMKMMITYYSDALNPLVPYTIDGVPHTKSYKRGVSTWVRDVADIQGSTLILKSVKYTVNACGQYALYYRNRKGGYDSFLIEGAVHKSDKFNKGTYQKYYTNREPMGFGKKDFHNGIITEYSLNTGWLTDSQSNNLAFNLLSSNEVFLHNLTDNTIFPVVITNSGTTYKNFKSNSQKLVCYEINVEESQQKQLI